MLAASKRVFLELLPVKDASPVVSALSIDGLAAASKCMTTWHTGIQACDLKPCARSRTFGLHVMSLLNKKHNRV